MTGTDHRESAVDRIRQRVEEKAARRAAAKSAQEEAGRDPQPDADRPPKDAPSEKVLPGVDADQPSQHPQRDLAGRAGVDARQHLLARRRRRRAAGRPSPRPAAHHPGGSS